jgi:hypothetical protein
MPKQASQNRPQKWHNQNQSVSAWRESPQWMGKKYIYPGTHPGPGVSHFADDPPGSAHQHPHEENKCKEKELGRRSGRVVTIDYWVVLILGFHHKLDTRSHTFLPVKSHIFLLPWPQLHINIDHSIVVVRGVTLSNWRNSNLGKHLTYTPKLVNDQMETYWLWSREDFQSLYFL